MTDEHAGFTGTRHGMTIHQREAVARMLPDYAWLHHGDCLGSDKDAHDLARALGLRVAIHPPTNPKFRSYCGGDIIHPPFGYLKRNQHIVLATVRLIAAPEGMEEELRSGTWSSIRYAQYRGKPVTIVFPDGSLRHV